MIRKLVKLEDISIAIFINYSYKFELRLDYVRIKGLIKTNYVTNSVKYFTLNGVHGGEEQ